MELASDAAWAKCGLLFQADQDVRRLDVVVDDPLVMGHLDGLSHRNHQSGSILGIPRHGQGIGDAASRAIFEGQPDTPFPGACFVNAQNIGMRQRRQDIGFPGNQTTIRIAIAGNDQFESHQPIQAALFGNMHHT